ncbi:FxsA cytoplasmic membrane protein [Methylophaga aminisulfidivorans MP]|uniref:FxsA cytoplasmic membrane protein n=2 Tax=Methylophaga TaxID=40222 RepID=F5SXW7_9GAMM|nr:MULTISPECIES: FxsA family protein [Methylophaga]EGL54035.1 FxsA cytoplasmic membrane protein [Methylophaga aminisulfidivorans MP]GLQ00325.1 membrane protein FxsA [Methylophaga thalassica]
MFRFLFLLFLIIPIVEIYVLIQVGDVIGALPTIFLVVATAVLGAFLLRLQGFQTLQRAQQSLASGQIPATEMLEGVCLVIAGAMLLTPGFVTDTLGFLLLIPNIRRLVIKHMAKNRRILYTQNRSGAFSQQRYRSDYREGDVIDGEVVDDDDKHHLR